MPESHPLPLQFDDFGLLTGVLRRSKYGSMVIKLRDSKKIPLALLTLKLNDW